MTEMLRGNANRRLALGAALAMLLLAPALGVQAAPASQEPGRIAVVVFPDLAGDVYGQPCPGCNEKFDGDDTDANAADPLPTVDVVLLDADGDEVGRNATNGLSNGRQVTFFTVTEQGSYTIELENVPQPWVPCPDAGPAREIEVADFSDTTAIATVDFFLWRDCDDGSAVSAGEATEEATDEPADATDEPTDEATDESTDESTDEPTDEATDEPTDEATEEPTDVPTEQATIVPTEEPTDEATAVLPVATTEAEGTDSGQSIVLGGIRGVVFGDTNGNGQLDPDEAGVADAELSLAGNGLVRTARSAGAGTYAFPDLLEGLYDVTITVPAGTELSTPAERLGVAVSGDVVMGIDFGLVVAVETVAPTSEPAEPTEPGTMPETGVQLHPRSSLLVGLAAAIGVVGTLGLVLESRRGRRSRLTRKGQQ